MVIGICNDNKIHVELQHEMLPAKWLANSLVRTAYCFGLDYLEMESALKTVDRSAFLHKTILMMHKQKHYYIGTLILEDEVICRNLDHHITSIKMS